MPCSEGYRCEIEEYRSAFFTEAGKLGYDLWALALPGAVAPSRGRGATLRKWHCGCMNLWAAVEVTGHCDACGEVYELEE